MAEESPAAVSTIAALRVARAGRATVPGVTRVEAVPRRPRVGVDAATARRSRVACLCGSSGAAVLAREESPGAGPAASALRRTRAGCAACTGVA